MGSLSARFGAAWSPHRFANRAAALTSRPLFLRRLPFVVRHRAIKELHRGRLAVDRTHFRDVATYPGGSAPPRDTEREMTASRRSIAKRLPAVRVVSEHESYKTNTGRASRCIPSANPMRLGRYRQYERCVLRGVSSPCAAGFAPSCFCSVFPAPTFPFRARPRASPCPSPANPRPIGNPALTCPFS